MKQVSLILLPLVLYTYGYVVRRLVIIIIINQVLRIIKVAVKSYQPSTSIVVKSDVKTGHI